MTAPAVRSLVDALNDPDPVAWPEWLASPELPDSTGLMWRPVEQFEEAGGHVWRGDRGPYAFCHRPGCRLAYGMWGGGWCEDGSGFAWWGK